MKEFIKEISKDTEINFDEDFDVYEDDDDEDELTYVCDFADITIFKKDKKKFTYSMKIEKDINKYFVKNNKDSCLDIKDNENLEYLYIEIERVLANLFSINKSFNDRDVIKFYDEIIENKFNLNEDFIYFCEIKSNMNEKEIYLNLINNMISNIYDNSGGCSLPEFVTKENADKYFKEIIFLFFLRFLVKHKISQNEFIYLIKKMKSQILDRNIYDDKKIYLKYISAFYDFMPLEEKKSLALYFNRFGRENNIDKYNIEKINNSFIDLNEVELISKPKIKVERNDLCPCGSNKKYKKCCMN